MSHFPIDCPSCSNTFESRDEMKKVERGPIEYTYHCPDCTIDILSITISNGDILDSKIVL